MSAVLVAGPTVGATENARPGNGRPQKTRDLKMQNLTLPDQIAGWEMQDLTMADQCAATNARPGITLNAEMMCFN